MNTGLKTMTEKYIKSSKVRMRWKIYFGLISTILVLCTVFTLMLPAISDSNAVYCGIEEHSHDSSCSESLLICGFDGGTQTDTESHVHSEECYSVSLVCTLAEHIHSLGCLSDPSADTESAEDWEKTFANVTLSSDGAQNIAAVARTQLGYKESSLNYAVAEDGTTKLGYTRYGAWNGTPYDGWNGLFVAFCAHYADIDSVPFGKDAAETVLALKDGEYTVYRDISYVDNVKTGDVVFFDTDSDGAADRMGIADIVDRGEKTIAVIEGDCNNRVSRVVYELTDPSISGYAQLSDGSVTVTNDASADVNVPGSVLYRPEGFSAYRYSSHRIDGIAAGTYVLLPYGGTVPESLSWSADSPFGYAVAYLMGKTELTGADGSPYEVVRAEDTEYAPLTESLEALLLHSYPFITADRMREELHEAYISGETETDLSCCGESEFIAAVQLAVWTLTGQNEGACAIGGASFPDEAASALAPLTDAGHTDDSVTQAHVEAICRSLLSRRRADRLTISSADSVTERRQDGLFDLTVSVTFDRALAEGESVSVALASGQKSSCVLVNGDGTDCVTLSLTELTADELTASEIKAKVSAAAADVFVYRGTDGTDMLGAKKSADQYELSSSANVETVSVDVSCVWTDGVIGADTVTLQLYADGEILGEPIVLSAESSWSFRRSGLIRYSAYGVPIEYSVALTPTPGYVGKVTRTDSEALSESDGGHVSFLVTNTLSESTASVTVGAEWSGKDDGAYPDSVRVTLLQNGTPYGNELVLSAENGWMIRLDGIPVRLGLDKLEYTLEAEPLSHYETVTEMTEDESGNIVFTLKSTYSPEYVSLTVEKKDASDPAVRLEGASFELYLLSDAPNAVTVPGSEGLKGVVTETFATDMNGKYTLDRLIAGETYCLVEASAPKHYNKAEKPIIIEIAQNGDGSPVISLASVEEWAQLTAGTESEKAVLEVFNHRGYVLPETGSFGDIPYYVIGALALLAIMLLMIYPKRKNNIIRR